MRIPAAHLLSKSGLVMLGRLAGAGFGFLTQVVLARTLPADELGLFFLATSIAAVIGSAAALGYPNMVPLLFARYQERSRPELASAFASYTRREAAYVSGLVTALVIFAVVVFGWVTGAGLAIAAAAFAIPATAPCRPLLVGQPPCQGSARCAQPGPISPAATFSIRRRLAPELERGHHDQNRRPAGHAKPPRNDRGGGLGNAPRLHRRDDRGSRAVVVGGCARERPVRGGSESGGARGRGPESRRPDPARHQALASRRRRQTRASKLELSWAPQFHERPARAVDRV